jgi:PAS domain S-box-containing protein
VVGPSSDKWGSFVSALIPIRAVDNGPVKAVMGIDILTDDVFYQVRVWRLAGISMTFLFIGFYIGFFFLYLRERKFRYDIQRNEKKFHGLFREMLNGFALHELVFDGSGKAVDYRFLEVNNAFERLTGLKADKIIGRTAKEVLQGLESKWVERYSAVALTGETIHFEEYNESLRKYFEVRAFCVVKGLQFAVTFEDVTKRKKAMEDLARMLIRIRRQQKAVLAIGRSNEGLSRKEVFENITTIAANAMDVARVSIWLGTLANGAFECQDLFEREKLAHSGGMLLDAGQFPMYFKAIDSGRVIDAYDAHKDLRTLELVTGYLKPAGISSVLHVAIKLNGVLSGLLCFERTGKLSRWHMDETRFASEIAGQIEILLLARRK